MNGSVAADRHALEHSLHFIISSFTNQLCSIEKAGGRCCTVSVMIVLRLSLLFACSSHVEVRWDDLWGILVEHSSAQGWEEVPESESLISSSGHYILSTRTHGEVKDSVRVACQGLHFLHGGIFPQDNLVEGVSMRAYDLVSCLREHQVAYLRSCINGMQRLEGVSVPESNVTISCSSTSGQKTVLMGWPADGLDSCCVLMELNNGLVGSQIPYHQFVVIATRRQLLVVERPLKAADFLLVSDHLAELVVLGSQISLQNVSILASSAHNWLVPCNGAYSG